MKRSIRLIYGGLNLIILGNLIYTFSMPPSLIKYILRVILVLSIAILGIFYSHSLKKIKENENSTINNN